MINGASHKHLNYIFVNKKNYFFVKVVSDLKFGHLYFFEPPLTSATSEVGWKTSNFNVGKREAFGVPLCEIINFEHYTLGVLP